jgi:hypothetical protein
MLRLFLVLGLLLSLFILVGGMTATWREEPVPPVEEMEKTPPRTVTDRRQPEFYPPVPGRLPDLNKGYIFNEARVLVDEKEGEGAAELVVDTTLDEAAYIGSVIKGQRRIGIVSYTEKSGAPPRAVTRGRPVMAAPVGESKHIQLAPGETFGGYTVAEVLPDRIVFAKNGRTMEKLLNVDKERKQAPQLQGTRPAQRQGGQARVVTPRQVEPAGRVPPLSGPEAGRPPGFPEPPPTPGTVIQGRPPQIIPGVEQPGG